MASSPHQRKYFKPGMRIVCRNMLRTGALSLFAFWPLLGQACKLSQGYDSFYPAMDSFQTKWNGWGTAALPAPGIGAIKVIRGALLLGSPCPDAGSVNLEIVWPKSSAYKLKDVGFYFRVLRGQQPATIFPPMPILGKVMDQRVQFAFNWLDPYPTESTLDLNVEVFAVNKGLQIGPSRQFRVVDTSGPGQR